MNKKAAAIVGGILVLGLGVFGFTKLNSGHKINKHNKNRVLNKQLFR